VFWVAALNEFGLHWLVMLGRFVVVVIVVLWDVGLSMIFVVCDSNL